MGHPCALLVAMLLGVAVAAGAAPAAAQEAQAPAERPHYDTGDAWIDARLADIDRYASAYPQTFAAEVERYAGIPRDYVQGLVSQPGWQAGDAWYACFLARVLERGCRQVVRARARLGAAGTWAAVETQLRGDGAAEAVTPGSSVALRLALADSYRRWGRALQPDTALRRALEQRQREREAEAEAEAGAEAPR